jgi:hypothetical protein
MKMIKRNLLLLWLIIITVPVLANPIVPGEPMPHIDPVMNVYLKGAVILIVTIALFSEYLYIRKALKDFFTLPQLMTAFLISNIITFPLTAWAAQQVFWYAEAIPLLTEPIIYLYVAYLFLDNELPTLVPQVFRSVTVANLVSFGVGVLLFGILMAIFKINV